MSYKAWLMFVSSIALGASLYACSSSGSDGAGGVVFSDGGTNPDGGIDGAVGGGQCKPADVSTFQPVAYRPATGLLQGACTAPQIDAFFQACLGGTSNKTLCEAFRATAANKPCAACIVTIDTDAKYGPIVVHAGSGLVSVNLAGCLELTDPANANCAKSYQASDDCTYTACKDNCAFGTDQEFALFESCVHAAATNGCSTLSKAAACADAEQKDGGLAARCFNGYTFAELYNDVVPVFCGGTPITDAGVDG